MKEFFISLFLSVSLTPLFSKVAVKLGIVDRPDNNLKNHGSAVPYLGGLALYVSILPFVRDLALLFVLTGFMVLGLIDDLKKLSWQLRLAVEFLLGAMLVLRFSRDLFGFLLNLVLTVALINAVNMSDGLDGACAVMVSIGILLSNFETVGLAFVGALVGYLVFNFPPARIYMGDAGTYLLGGFVSYLIVSNMSHPLDYRPVLPFLLPLLDLFAAVVRRVSHHRSPFKGDLDHIHHKFFRRTKGTDVLRKRKVVFVIGTITAAFGAASRVKAGILLVAAVAVLLVVCLKLFTYDEKEE